MLIRHVWSLRSRGGFLRDFLQCRCSLAFLVAIAVHTRGYIANDRPMPTSWTRHQSIGVTIVRLVRFVFLHRRRLVIVLIAETGDNSLEHPSRIATKQSWLLSLHSHGFLWLLRLSLCLCHHASSRRVRSCLSSAAIVHNFSSADWICLDVLLWHQTLAESRNNGSTASSTHCLWDGHAPTVCERGLTDTCWLNFQQIHTTSFSAIR